MAFLEARIDPRITHECRFSVEHPARLKAYNGAGQLARQTFGDSPPKHRVNLQHGVKTEAQFQALVDAFYVVMFTPYEGLRVKNWGDFRATATNTTVAAVTGGYQLQRKHSFGGIDFARDITKPVNDGTLIVMDASNAPLTATIDYETGIFTASGTPAKWSGTFDTPMTFEANRWDVQLLTSQQGVLLVSDAIWMEEVRGVEDET